MVSQFVGGPDQITYSSFYTDSNGVIQTHTSAAPISVAVVVTLIQAGLWLGLVLLVRGGRNWARILLTILAAIFGLLLLAGSLPSMFGGSNPSPGLILNSVLGLAVVGLEIAAIVFMYSSEALWYFRRIR